MDDRFGPNDLFAAFRFANELEAQPFPWLWPHRIPLGQVSLLVGDPGVGKSLLAADLAARVSAAHPWPDQPAHPIPDHAPPTSAAGPSPSMPSVSSLSFVGAFPYPAGVVLVAPEDSAPHTLLPRLTAAGANLDHISILEGVSRTCTSYLRPYVPPSLPLTLPDHADELEQAIRAHDHPRLVILDPLSALLAPAAYGSPHAVANLFAVLTDIAHRKGLAILAVTHLSKTRAHHMLYRVRGSLSFVAAARAVHLLSPDPDQPDRRILTPLKTIHGPPPPPLAFRIAPPPPACRIAPPPPPLALGVTPSQISNLKSPSPSSSAPRLVWEIPDPDSPDLAHASPDLLDLAPDAWSALSEACHWLTASLAAAPRPASEIIREARAIGIAPRTLHRAKRLLGVRSLKPTNDSPWLWSLSPKAP